MKKRNINALSLATIVTVIVFLVCSVLYILHHDFGLLSEETYRNTNYTVEFVVKDSKNINFTENKEIYFYNSREFFGVIKEITYNETNEMVVIVESNGFYKNDKFLLNGRTLVTQGSKQGIMNNNVQITITDIY